MSAGETTNEGENSARHIRRPPQRAPRGVLWWIAFSVGAVLLGLVVTYSINMERALAGDARTMPMAEAWSTADLAAVLQTQVAHADAEATIASTPAPILDTLVAGWQAQTNRIYPFLIVKAMPTRAADVVIVLNPTVYRLWSPSEFGMVLQELAATWRVVLATSGALWPAYGKYEPGLIVLRRAAAPGAPPELIATSRDGSTSIRWSPLSESAHARP